MGLKLRKRGVGRSKLLKWGVFLSGAMAVPAAASVIVLGNYKTGEVVIQGNLPGGAEVERAVGLATGGTDAGWTQIYGPDDDPRGWGALLCVRHAKGIFFAEARGETSEEEALRTVNLKADRFLVRLVDQNIGDAIEKSAQWPALARQAVERGLGEKVKCAPTWNNQGQPIEFVGKPLGADDEAAKEAPEDKPADEVADEAPEKEAPEPTEEAKPAATETASAPPTPKRDYEAEYQERLRQWEALVAERNREVAAFEEATRQFEQDKLARAQCARQEEEAYRRALDEHAAKVAAVAEENRRRQAAYEQQLATLGNAAAGPIIDFPEAVSVCELDRADPQSQFGNWKCVGPLQFTYAKLGGTGGASQGAMYAVRDSCGGKLEDVRDLGMVKGYRVFGCSFGINPNPRISLSRDSARQFGLDFIDGRMLFRCPATRSSCRTR